MFKKKKKNQKEFKKVSHNIIFDKEKKEKSGISVRIKKEGDYAVIEPYDIWDQKKISIRQKPKTLKEEVVEIKKKYKKEVKTPKKAGLKPEEVEKKEVQKPKEVKQKLIIQKIKPKEIKSESPIQKALPKLSEKVTKESIYRIPLDHIETDIDKLMDIIEEKEIVDLDYLSKELKIDVKTLEAWAKILEDRGLIDILYPIFGLPKLRKKKWKKKS